MSGGAVAVAAGQPRPHALLQRLPRLLEGGELPGLAGGVAGGGAGAGGGKQGGIVTRPPAPGRYEAYGVCSG